ncbi:MAG: aldehyde dehydrogenase [Planctomycetota bacterium]|jgi:aminomuconate-semialdehyde/2-hydroxymuconate-6-semialdehyde dehydrogenase
MHSIANYIDGELVEPASGSYFDDIDPATGDLCAAVPDSDDRDVDRAVAAARRAFDGWSATPAAQRSRTLLRLADLIEENLEGLACLESIDTGKPLAVARTVDIPRAAANFRFFATAILHTRTEAHQTDTKALNLTLRKPRGVAGLISPWNLPLYLFSWKVAPAIATGNTAVGKPSELTPLTAHRLAELSAEAGLPPGVLNIVHGLGEKAGAAIVGHPDVSTISFTGGTDTGALIARIAGPMFKRLALECGGKNPTIVFADADLEEALPTSVRAAFSNQGEICLCGSRIFVERSIVDRFVDAFVAHTRRLRVGDPLDGATDLGALISREHLEKVESYVALAQSEGGTIRCGGRRPSAVNDRCRNGVFLEPTVVTGLDAQCRTNQEEIFGPVVTIMPFDGQDEAVALANATPYGLSASLWTQSLDRAHRVAGQLQAGTVWVNCWLLRDLRVPFGGMKESGLGREGGEDAIRFFTEPKNVCIRLRD